MSNDFDEYLRYKRPAGFQFEFPAGKKFVWATKGEKRDRTYEIAEVLDESDPKTVVIRLRDSTEQKTVAVTEVEGVNPAKFDGVEDCATLGYLSQPSVLHNLKLRYDAKCIYTHSGLFTVAINPYKLYPIYTDSVIKRYNNKRREEVPPHVFSVADSAYRLLLRENKSQSMLVTGESGAGKTENTKRVIQYLAHIAGRSGAEGTLEKQLLQANPLLEALGNAKTLKNNNSSRFGKFIKITFESSGYISGASIVSYLLETSRVVAQGPGERNFHIFYQLFTAPQELQNRLKIGKPTDFFYLNQSGCVDVPGVDDSKEFQGTLFALKTLGFTEEEQELIFRTCAGILHLGNTEFVGEDHAAVKDEGPLAIAASLLKVDKDLLKQGLIAPRITISQREKVARAMTPFQSGRSRDALCKSIYNRLFLWVVDKINQTLKVHNEHKFIGILDIAGFEIFKHNSFEQLCINFTNERLQQFFNNHMFNLEQEEYKREKIEWTFINFGIDSQATIDLISKKPRGILQILDEQSVFPKASDESFVELLVKTHGGRHPKFRRDPLGSQVTFGVDHYAGEVEYNSQQWLEKNKDPLQDDLAQCIAHSSDKLLSSVFTKFATTGVQRGASFMTVGLKYREQLDDLMSTLEATYPHFIRCIIPNHQQLPGVIDDAIVLDQLACNGVLEGIRISRLGFPNRMPYQDFLKRYYIIDQSVPKSAPDPKAATKKIIDRVVASKVIDVEKVRFGVTKIFFRAGEMAKVEEMREKIVGEMVLGVQALCRGYVGRKVYAQIRAKKTAALIIQKAIRDFDVVRKDPWWRLVQKLRDPAFLKFAEQEKAEKQFRDKLEAIEQQKQQVEAQKQQIRQRMAELEREKMNILEDLQGVKDNYIRKRSELDQSLALLRETRDELEATEETLKETEGELKSRQLEAAGVELKIREASTSASAGDHEAKKIEKELREVEDKLKKAKELLEAEKETVQQLTKSKSNLDHEIDLRQGDFEGLTQKKSILTLENNQTQGEVMRLGAEKLKVISDNKAAEKKVQTLQAEVKDLVPRLAKLTKERQDLEEAAKKNEKVIVGLQADVEETKQRGSDLKKDTSKLEGDSMFAQESVDSAKKANKKTTDAIRAAKDSQFELEGLLKSLTAENAAFAAANSKSTARTEELKKKIQAATDKIASLTKEVASLNGKIEELQASVEAVDKQNSDLAKSSKRLEEELASLREQNKELLGTKEKDLRTKDKAETRIKELQAMIKDEKSRKETHDGALQKHKAQNEQLRTEIEQLKQDRDRAIKANEQLTKQIHTLQLEVKGAQQVATDLQKRLESTLSRRQDLNEQKDLLAEEKSKIESRQERAADAIAVLRKKLTDAQDANKFSKERSSTASAEIEKLVAEQTRLTKEIESLEKKNRQLDNEYKDKKERLRAIEDEQTAAKKEEVSIETAIVAEKSQLEAKEAALERLKQEQRRTEEEIDQYQRKVAEANGKVAEITRDIKELEEKVRNGQDAVAREVKTKDLLKKRLVEIEDEKEDIQQAQLEAANQKIMEEREAKVRKEIFEVTLQIEDLQKKKLEEERARLGLEGELDIARRNQKLILGDIDNQERERRAIFSRIQFLTKETMQIEANSLVLEQRIKATEKKLAKATKGAERQSENKEQDMADEAEKVKKIRALNGDIRQLENELKNEKRGLEHYEAKAVSAIAEIDHLKQAIVDSENQIVNMRRYADLLEGEVADVKVEIEAVKEMKIILTELSGQKDQEKEEVKKETKEAQVERDRHQARVNELKRELVRVIEDIKHESVQAEKDRSIAHRLNNLISQSESNEKESPLAAPEQERLEVIRRQTQRAQKRTEKLKTKLQKLLIEKDAQDKITWQLQDDYQNTQLLVHDAAVQREIAQKEVDHLHKQVLALQEFCRNAESEAEKARIKAQELAFDADRLKDAVAEYEDKNSILDRDRIKHKLKIKDLTQELEYLEGRNAELSADNLGLDFQRRELKRKVADERDARQEEDARAHRYVMALEKNKNELHLLKVSLGNEERESLQIAESYKQTQHALNKLEKRLAVEGESVRIESQIQIVRDELETARKRTAEAKAEARAKEEEMEALQFDIKSLRYDIAQLELRKNRMERAQHQLQKLLASQRRLEEDDELDLDDLNLDDNRSERSDTIEVA